MSANAIAELEKTIKKYEAIECNITDATQKLGILDKISVLQVKIADLIQNNNHIHNNHSFKRFNSNRRTPLSSLSVLHSSSSTSSISASSTSDENDDHEDSKNSNIFETQ